MFYILISLIMPFLEIASEALLKKKVSREGKCNEGNE